MRWARIAALAPTLACGTAVEAQTTSTVFPFPSWHARPAALGGAGTAGTGIEFTSANPAGLDRTRGAQLSFHEAPAGSNDGLIALAHTGHWGTASLTVQRRDWGAVAEQLGLDDLAAGEQAIRVGYARSFLNRGMAVGAAVSRLDSDYLGVRAGGWAFDAGFQADLGAGARVGGALIHAGRLTNDEGEEVQIPSRVRAGAGLRRPLGPAAVVVLADAALPMDGRGRADLHAGTETSYTGADVTGALRVGWRSLGNPYGAGDTERAFSVGAGIGFGRIRADAARVMGGTLGDATHVSLSIGW